MNDSTCKALDFFEVLINDQSYTRTTEWKEKRNLAIATLKSLYPIYKDYADIQIQKSVPYLFSSPIIMQCSLPIQLPDIYSKFSTIQAKEELRNSFLDILELGALIELSGFAYAPLRPGTPEIKFDLEVVRYSLKAQAETIFRLQFAPRGLNKHADQVGGLAQPTWERFVHERVTPFYKSHGVKSGFMFANIGKAMLQAKAVFYVGVEMAILHANAI